MGEIAFHVFTRYGEAAEELDAARAKTEAADNGSR